LLNISSQRFCATILAARPSQRVTSTFSVKRANVSGRFGNRRRANDKQFCTGHVMNGKTTLHHPTELLKRSSELAVVLEEFIHLPPYSISVRIVSSHTLCGVSFEHAESVRILTGSGNFTSSLGVLRMQYEALVKAFWTLYAASDEAVDKLQVELTYSSAKSADKVPTLAEMLAALSGKAPPQAIYPLLEFKDYSWKPLSSYIHGGIHATQRHRTGYPETLLCQATMSSNGLLIMAAMMLVILSGDSRQTGKIRTLQERFADCLPSLSHTYSATP
jgi:hypothetical protein